MRPVGRRFVLAAAILLCAAAPVAGAEWMEISSGLPRTMAVKSLVIDSATPTTLYAVDNQGWLFKSVDSGGSWNQIGLLSGVKSVAVDPKNSSVVYVATDGGLLRSADGAKSWAWANNGLIPFQSISTTVWMIVIDPLNPATLYAETFNGIFKSTDGAGSWKKLDSVPLNGTINLPANNFYFSGGLTIDPTNPSTIYYELPDGHSILKSSDGGQSWTRLSIRSGIGSFLAVGGFVIDPSTSSTLYATSAINDGSILKSTDGGQSWTAHAAAPPGTSITSLAIDPASLSTVYAVYWSGESDWGIWKSMDSGENWSAFSGLPALPDLELPASRCGGGAAGTKLVPCGATFLVAVSPTTPSTIYTVYFVPPAGGHLAKSTDGGASWNAADAGLGYIDVHALAIDPVTSKIYAGMGGAAANIPLFQSADGGAHWTSVAEFSNSRPGFGSYGSGWIAAVAAPAGNPNLVYVATTDSVAFMSSVFKTMDGGTSWIRTPFSTQQTTVMALDPADPQTVYAGEFLPWDEGQAFLTKSVDGGSSWTESFRWDPGPLYTLVADPRNPGTLYAGTTLGAFKSIDSGASWSDLGLSGGVVSLAVDPADSHIIYAAAGSYDYTQPRFLGLFKSGDGGGTWVGINNGLDPNPYTPVTAIAFAPGNSSTVYVARSGFGVWKSSDGGTNWGMLNEGLANLDVRSLAVDSNAFYAGTASGIFKKID